jgi:hypothetical protein
MKRIGWLTVGTIALTLLGSSSLRLAHAQDLAPEVMHYADLVFYNGSVLTMDRDKAPFAVTKALAVRDGRILATGTDERILKMAGPRTTKVNLNGKAVMPGIIDTHAHLYEYAIYKNAKEYQALLIRGLRSPTFRYVTARWQTKETVLADLKRAAEAATPGQSLGTMYATDVTANMTSPAALRQLTRFDLDTAVPNNPLFVITGIVGTSGIANTKMLDIIVATYGDKISGYGRDEKGVLNGRVDGAVGETVNEELFPQVAPELTAPFYKKELDEWVAMGVTTVSSRLGGSYISAFSYMDQQGQLPLRMAYSHEVGRYNPFLERYLRRFGGLQGHGTDRMWMIGLSIANPDGDPPAAPHGRGGNNCTTVAKLNVRPDDVYPQGQCYWDEPDDPSAEAPVIANRYGYRISGVHNIGDKAVLQSLNAYEKANQEKSILGKRFALDHGQMISQDNIKQAAKLGAMWSLQPFLLYDIAPVVAEVWGEEVAQRWTMPTKSMLDAGIKFTYGADRWADPQRRPWWGLQVLVERKAANGKIYGEREKLDRATVLLMMTRWGAEYVLREKELGSLEPGKLADLVVLDQNPLDTNLPDASLSQLKVIATLVGGKIAYGSFN